MKRMYLIVLLAIVIGCRGLDQRHLSEESSPKSLSEMALLDAGANMLKQIKVKVFGRDAISDYRVIDSKMSHGWSIKLGGYLQLNEISRRPSEMVDEDQSQEDSTWIKVSARMLEAKSANSISFSFLGSEIKPYSCSDTTIPKFVFEPVDSSNIWVGIFRKNFKNNCQVLRFDWEVMTPNKYKAGDRIAFLFEVHKGKNDFMPLSKSTKVYSANITWPLLSPLLGMALTGLIVVTTAR